MTPVTASIATLLLVSAGPAFAQGVPRARTAQTTSDATVNVGGEWTFNLDTPKPTVFRAGFRQEGKKVTGYMSNEVAEYPLTGTVEGSQVKLTWSQYEGGEKIEIVITGTFEREAITGTAKIGDIAQVGVSAQRTAAP